MQTDGIKIRLASGEILTKPTSVARTLLDRGAAELFEPVKTADDHQKALTFLQQRSDFVHLCDVAQATFGAIDITAQDNTARVLQELQADGEVVNYAPDKIPSSYWKAVKRAERRPHRTQLGCLVDVPVITEFEKDIRKMLAESEERAAWRATQPGVVTTLDGKGVRRIKMGTS